jgi:hypothetical protein
MGLLNQNLYPVPSSWEEFEQMLNDIALNCYPNMVVERYGRQGQKQKGIDILIYNDKTSIGIQCKNVVELTTPEIDKILDSVSIKIQQLIIATSISSDVKLIDYVRSKTSENLIIQILFWENIVNLLVDNKLISKYYPEFFGDEFGKIKDRNLFAEFSDDFINNGLRNYFSTLTAMSQFNSEKIFLFFRAIEKWSDINYMFHYPEIEICRMSFIKVAKNLVSKIAINTWNDERNYEYNIIPREWITQQPARYEKVVKSIDEELSLFRQYIDLMIFCGKKYNLL